jgi:hypothetical protein
VKSVEALVRDGSLTVGDQHKLDQVLHLIQRSLRQDEKRNEALTLFSKVFVAVSSTPDIGTVFFVLSPGSILSRVGKNDTTENIRFIS